MSEQDDNIRELFVTDNLLTLKRAVDNRLNITPYSEKFEFLDQIEFNIIPEFYISIETKTQISTSGLSFPMDDREIAMAKEKIKFLEKYVSDKRKYFQTRKSLRETKIDIITALLWDSNFVLKLVEEQIRWRDYKKYIIASNRELFDNVKLHSYLTTLNEATPFLKNQIRDILVRIGKIIDFDNGILQEILNETNKKEISNKIDFGGNSFHWLAYNYECIIVEETQKRYVNLESEENRYYFQSNYTNNTFDSNDFAHKANSIHQTLTGFLNINTIEDLNIFLNISDSSSEKIDHLPKMEDEMKVEIFHRSKHPEMFDSKTSLTNQTQEIKHKHPEHNPNLWNNECFELFKFLFDEYYNNGTKRQLLNIWFFLKQYKETKNSIYATKEKYKEFILKHYQINITNKAIPDNWHEIEFPKIKGVCSIYNS